MQDVFDKAKGVRLAIFDVDGVLTDGKLYFTDAGEEIKAFNSQDGHGMKMLKASGVELAIITGRRSRCVEARAKNLGVELLYQGVENKLVIFQELIAKLGLSAEQTAYMGDDVVDLPVLRRCGLALAVPEAPELVKQHVHYVTRQGGGCGAVREVCELILCAQDCFAAQMAAFLS